MAKKILVKIWEPALKELNRMTNEAGLKRDYFLNNVFKHEAQMLKKEVPQANSERAKKYIASELTKNSLKPVNLLLEPQTIDEINNACKEKNIPRDAFINRVILLLTATSEVLDKLFFYGNGDYDDYVIHVMDNYGDPQYYPFRANIIDTITEFVKTDPFWLLRECLELEIRESLHDISLENDDLHEKISDKIINFSDIHIIGFNCYLSNDTIDLWTDPNRKAKELKELDGLFFEFLSENDKKEKIRKADRDNLQNKLINSGDKNA